MRSVENARIVAAGAEKERRDQESTERRQGQEAFGRHADIDERKQNSTIAAATHKHLSTEQLAPSATTVVTEKNMSFRCICFKFVFAMLTHCCPSVLTVILFPSF